MFSHVKKPALAGLITLACSLGTSPAHCQQLAINVSSRHALPPCNMDSFVYQAGAQAEAIYGDEGHAGPPPINGFTKASRINAGIYGVNDAGLTTGHGSYMPDGTGGDEFEFGPIGEWDLSGPSGNSQSAPIYGMPTFNYNPDKLEPNLAYAAKGQGIVVPNPSSRPNKDGHFRVEDGYGNLLGYMTKEEAQLAQTDQFHALLQFYNTDDYLYHQQVSPAQ